MIFWGRQRCYRQLHHRANDRWGSNIMQNWDAVTVLPTDARCITRPASNADLLQVALEHPSQGWIAVELDRRAASKLALELQAFVDYRSTADEDA